VRVKGNKIQFVELKRIQDNRLLHKDSSEVTPEIITQIEEYRNFIKANKDAILAYYKELITIKRALGLPTTLADIETLDIDTEVSSVMDYFEIFLARMTMCRKAAETLGLRFKLVINQQELL
jgi:hypothetical protein